MNYEDVASELLQCFEIDGDKRAPLLEHMTLIVQMVDAYKKGFAFQPLPSKTEVNKQLNQLSGALLRVRSIMDKMNKDVLTAINRSLYDGEIPLLDEACARAGHFKTPAHQGIGEIVYNLCGKLDSHMQNIDPQTTKPGSDDNFTRFLASGLAWVYRYATDTEPTARTDWGSGKAYGPFYDFVNSAKERLELDLSTEHLVRKVRDAATCDKPVTLFSSILTK
jgi:hypothetical protein